MRGLILGALLLTLPATGVADDGDDTLHYYLSKAELAVAAEIVSDPEAVFKEAGVANYRGNIRVFDVLKGTCPKKELYVNIVRFEAAEEDRLPYLKKGAKCILFLKGVGPNEIPPWKTVDVWFGIQPYGPWRARSLKRLAKPEALEDVRAAGVARARQFWTALAKADTKTMQELYAPTVVLKKGSELLKKQWGLQGGGERDKDLSVERDELIAGYQRMIAEIGKERWSKLFGEIDAEKISFTLAKQSDRRTGVRKGDLTMKVSTGPGDDALFFVLRHYGEGRWQVVAEATDY